MTYLGLQLDNYRLKVTALNCLINTKYGNFFHLYDEKSIIYLLILLKIII